MKRCSKCGKQYNNETDYCINCGIKLEEMQSDENEIYTTEETKIQQSKNDILIDIDEEVYAELETGYIKNIITSGDISSVKAILTQKRLYLSGKTYVISRNTLLKRKESKIINIEDVTGTGFVYFSNAIYLVIAAISFLLCIYSSYNSYWEEFELNTGSVITFIVAVVFLCGFFINRKSLFKIEYSGGSIGFDVKWLNSQESVIFQKMIYLVKDKRKKEIIRESLNEKENT